MARALSAIYSKTGKTVKLRIADGEKIHSLTVYAEVYEAADCLSDGEISEDALAALLRDDELWRAEARALRLLEYSDSSKAELTRKLLARGFCREAAERAVIRMTELGYINEERRLRTLIVNEANTKLRGPKRIYAKLLGAGYSRELVSSVIRELSQSGEIDFQQNARRLIEKRGEGLSSDEKNRLLYTNGYK